MSGGILFGMAAKKPKVETVGDVERNLDWYGRVFRAEERVVRAAVLLAKRLVADDEGAEAEVIRPSDERKLVLAVAALKAAKRRPRTTGRGSGRSSRPTRRHSSKP